MKCPELERLTLYHAELLTNIEREQIERHLAECDRCRQEIFAFDRTVQLLENAPIPAVPDDLWAGIASRLPSTSPHSRGQWWWKLSAAGVLTAGLLMGFLMTHSLMLPPAPSMTASYVSEHELLSAQDPLADRATLGAQLLSQQDVSR